MSEHYAFANSYRPGDRVSVEAYIAGVGLTWVTATVDWADPARGVAVLRDDGRSGDIDSQRPELWGVWRSASIRKFVDDYEWKRRSAADVAGSARPAKYDADKRRWDLLLVDCDRAADAIMEVLEFGLSKYGEGTTWKTVDPKRYKRAAMRHLIASLRGETRNQEDGGVQHLAQAATCLLFALQNELDPSKQETKK